MKGSVPATGWDTGLCQDYDRKLALWFATRPEVRHFLKGTQMNKGSKISSLREELEALAVKYELDVLSAQDNLANFTIQVHHPEAEKRQLAETAIEVLEALGFHFNGVTWVESEKDTHTDTSAPIKPPLEGDLFTSDWPMPKSSNG